MTPFDPVLPVAANAQTSLDESASARAARVFKNKTRSFDLPPPAGAGALPACWRGATPFQLMIHGPDSARFEAAPPANPEPPEPEEQIGDALTERQLAFCERYVECPVATRAARAAGYAPSTAATQASRLLKHPLVMRRILELRRKRQLEQAYRRETLMDKFEAVFSEAIEGRDYYAAIQALSMQARLAGLAEAMPGLRYVRHGKNAGEQMVWDAVERLEQKLGEIAAGAYPGAAAAPDAGGGGRGR